jgi:hypothetical protein
MKKRIWCEGMDYITKVDHDHMEQHNCRKQDTFGQELEDISYLIEVRYMTEEQYKEVLATVEKVFAEHLAKETEKNLKHIARD